MTLHVDYTLTIGELSRECIEGCSRPGCDASAAVQHWRQSLGLTVNRDRAVDCLAGYGAWDREELTAKTDDDIAEMVLWLACGTFSEFITEAEDAGVDPFGELPDDFEPNCGSDIFVLE